jgi:hypothetical protein
MTLVSTERQGEGKMALTMSHLLFEYACWNAGIEGEVVVASDYPVESVQSRTGSKPRSTNSFTG